MCSWKEPSPQDMADLLPSGSGVGAEDIMVDILKQNLTAGNDNPLDKVSFYDLAESSDKRLLRHSDMTALQVNRQWPDKQVVGTPKKPQPSSALPGGALADASRKRKLFETESAEA